MSFLSLTFLISLTGAEETSRTGQTVTHAGYSSSYTVFDGYLFMLILFRTKPLFFPADL